MKDVRIELDRERLLKQSSKDGAPSESNNQSGVIDSGDRKDPCSEEPWGVKNLPKLL
jgi:hypothetical protein